MPSKQYSYLIEYTTDPNYLEWYLWDSKPYKSFAEIKEVVHKLSIQEQEFNTANVNRQPVCKITGFRIIEEIKAIETNVLTETLLT